MRARRASVGHGVARPACATQDLGAPMTSFSLRLALALPDDAMRFSFRTLALPPGVTPTVAGLVVGLVTAVIGFSIVALVTLRKRPRREVMVVPPYATLEAVRETPLPAAVFPTSSPPEAVWPAPSPPAFIPSTDLSA